MADNRTPESRSELMGKIGAKNTKPELIVRRLAHGLGYRFRLHRPDLPGKPDLVFPRLRKAVLVHGCFWHRHDCSKATTPKTNRPFWENKFRQNVERDARVVNDLQGLGWDTLTVWECDTRDNNLLGQRLESFLGSRV